MPVAEDRNEHRFHHLVLANYHPKHFIAALLVALKKSVYGFFIRRKT
jgi:hypothetical protein